MNTIEAPPKAGQTISHGGKEYTTIKEGLAHILVPHGIPTSTDPKMSKEDTARQQVFYNPIQQFNRDLSVLAIKTFGQDFVERKRQKHEQSTMKMKKRKKREEKKKNICQGAVGDGHLDVSERAESPSKKRRVEETGEVNTMADIAGNRDPEEVDIVLEAPAENPSVGDAPLHTAGASDQSKNTTNGTDSYKPPFKILDALSATGLRALRYANEIPFATSITANDLSSRATDSIKLNVKHNKLEDRITVNAGNAIAHMYSFVEKHGYDVIDLDPYGTAAPFIDASIQAINDEGLLCVTCTDSAIFASHGYLEKTYSQYGGLPLKGEPCHEGGLRLILHAIASSAARYGMAIEPLLSLSIDYYIRVFVRIRKSPNDVKLLAGKTMLVYHCQSGCGSWSTQFLARNKPNTTKDGKPSYKHGFAQGPSANQLCEHCGIKTHLSGPMYGGPLHNSAFVERMLAGLQDVDRETYATKDRMEGMLRIALEEITFGVRDVKTQMPDAPRQLHPFIPKADPAEIDHHPFFFIPSSVAKVIHCQAPPLAAMRGALRSAGFRVAMSHCKPGSIRTDASWTDIWHIMLEWARQRAPLKKPLKKEIPGYNIISKSSAYQMGLEKEKEEDFTRNAAVEVVESSTSESNKAIGNAESNDSSVSRIIEGSSDASPSYLSAKYKVVFNDELGKDHDRGKYVRYQLAPRENWGPMSRAKITQ
ncbi:TRM-domain-containing protein [Lindgomyces ingoldianus]|uniref:TRM-domain-containing protein n=1 Tax=Lindgomyces ingoldianus TaxID=673940 RepID=A0ACB6R386_9PLEO|nr:TRM-domain-containing protein [Lindgomyces ingoldianus]KAF2473288.1 TRM-domain-containing protein [Lindgomyces ingoldianus]